MVLLGLILTPQGAVSTEQSLLALIMRVKTACPSRVPWKPSHQQVALVATLQASGSTGSSEATLES